uniref:CCHC-type domain-containing protein n=1 Tax=Trichogramma kaykai TaxID=54128 RepID=A0ABD2VRR0_9HYME
MQKLVISLAGEWWVVDRMSYSELFENVTLKKLYETDRQILAALNKKNNRQELKELRDQRKQLLSELAPKTIVDKQLAEEDADISIIENINTDKRKFSLKPATLKLYTSTPEVKNKVVLRVDKFLKTIPEQVEQIKRENQVDEDIINKSVTDAIFEEEETVKNSNIVDKLFNPFKDYFFGHEQVKTEENASLPNSNLVPKQEHRDPEHGENSEHGEDSDIRDHEQENEVEMAAAVESALFKRLLKGISNFDGSSKQNTRRFVKDCRLAGKSLANEEVEKKFILQLKEKIIGPSADIINLELFSKIDKLCLFLESAYGETRSATQLIKDLDSIHQKDGEKVSLYYARVAELEQDLEFARERGDGTNLPLNNIKELILNAFKAGLIWQIKARMPAANNLEGAYESAVKIENELKAEDERRSSSTRQFACAFCRSTAHDSADCIKVAGFRADKASPPTQTNDTKCLLCGALDHFAVNCEAFNKLKLPGKCEYCGASDHASSKCNKYRPKVPEVITIDHINEARCTWCQQAGHDISNCFKFRNFANKVNNKNSNKGNSQNKNNYNNNYHNNQNFNNNNNNRNNNYNNNRNRKNYNNNYNNNQNYNQNYNQNFNPNNNQNYNPNNNQNYNPNNNQNYNPNNNPNNNQNFNNGNYNTNNGNFSNNSGPGYQNNNNNGDNRVCYRCHQPGHISKNCFLLMPNTQAAPPGQSQAQQQTTQ